MAGLPILRGVFPAAELYNHALSSAYQTEFRILDPDFSQEREADIWEKIRRDGKVAQAINQRAATVASRNWTVEQASDEPQDIQLARIVKKILDGIAKFRAARKQLVYSVFRGRSYAWIEGRRLHRRFLDLPAMDWWLPMKLRNMDKRRFELRPHKRKNGSIQVDRMLWSVARRRWEVIDPRAPIIELVFEDEEERLGYGRGLLDSIYFLWWAKQRVIKEGLQAVERWAQGFLLGKVDTSQAGTTGRDSENIRNAMRDELHKNRSKHIAVVDKADDVSLVSLSGEGHQIGKEMRDYLDNCILSTAMGSPLPFGGGSDKGSLARAEVEKEVSDEVVEFDRGELDEVITDGLISLILRHNQAQLSRLGLLDAREPHFKTFSEKREDPERNARVVSVSLGSGIPLKKEEVYDKIGFTQPTDDDEVFEGGLASPPPTTLPSSFSFEGSRAAGPPSDR